MKTLQNNFTTPEQSKRLLELGVPAWTADCYNTTKHIGIIPDGATYKDVWQMSIWRDEDGNHIEMYPCWSVGRLIEIYCLCVDERYSIEFIGQIHTRPMNKILDLFEYVKLDFEKLEE